MRQVLIIQNLNQLLIKIVRKCFQEFEVPLPYLFNLKINCLMVGVLGFWGFGEQYVTYVNVLRSVTYTSKKAHVLKQSIRSRDSQEFICVNLSHSFDHNWPAKLIDTVIAMWEVILNLVKFRIVKCLQNRINVKFLSLFNEK